MDLGLSEQQHEGRKCTIEPEADTEPPAKEGVRVAGAAPRSAEQHRLCSRPLGKVPGHTI